MDLNRKGKILLFVSLIGYLFVQDVHSYTHSDVKRLRAAILGISNDYDFMVRPQETMDINIRFNLVAVSSLDFVDMQMSTNGWLLISWTDSRLDFDPAGYTTSVFHALEGEVWRPELVVENTKARPVVLADQYLSYRVLESGQIIWEVPVSLVTACETDTTFFPFDQHTCNIVVSSWSLVATENHLKKTADTVNTDHYIGNSEWTLVSTSVTESLHNETVFSESRVYSKLIFTLRLKRKADFYSMSVFFVLNILSLLSCLVFVIPHDSGEKFSYSVTVILCELVAFTIILAYLPVSSLSILAIYMAFVLLMSVVIVVCEVLVSRIHCSKEHDLSGSMLCVTRVFARLTCWKRKSDKDDILYKESDTISSGLSTYVNGTLGKDPSVPGKKSTLPPVDSSLLRKNKVRPKSDSSVKNVKRVTIRSAPEYTQKEAVRIWDRFFFVFFMVVLFLVNFTFICTICVGGST